MPDATNRWREDAIFQAVFGPAKWYIKAGRVLNLHPKHVLKLANGQVPVRRRHMVTIENYLRNRRGAYSTETKAAIARIHKAEAKALAGFRQAEAALRALDAEMKRQGL